MKINDIILDRFLNNDLPRSKINKIKLNGSRFYAFTDGLSESMNNDGEELGIDGSINIIENNYNKDTIKQLNDITKSVINTSKNQILSDDLTLISIGK